MKKVPAKRRRMVQFGAAFVIFVCVVIALMWGFPTPPSLREPTCSAGETAFFNKDGWWCVPARKQ